MRNKIIILILLVSQAVYGQLGSPFMHFSFDNVLDDSGSANLDLKAYGNAQFTDAIKAVGSHAGLLDGSDDYWRIPIGDLGSAFTVSFWIRSDITINATTGAKDILDIADAVNYFRLYVSTSSRVVAKSQAVDDYAQYLTFTPTTWHHIVVTFNKTAGIVRMYLDNVRPASFSDSTFTNTFNSNDSIFIGNDYTRGGDWDGQIDELRFYKFVVSIAQVDSLFDLTYRETSAPPAYSPTLIPYVNGVEKKPYGDIYLKYMSWTPYVLPPPYESTYIGIDAIMGTEDYDGGCPTGSTRFTDTDCAANDFTRATIRPLLDSADYAYKVYINPDVADGGTGTLADPYNDFPATLLTSRAYLIKRGTILYQPTQYLYITTSNIMIGAYGTGDRPIIEKTAKGHTFWVTLASDVVFRDLDLRDPFYDIYDGYDDPATPCNGSTGVDVKNEVASAFQLQGAENIDIYNCNIQYQVQAVRSWSSTDNVRVIDCDIHNIFQDAFNVLGFGYFEIGFTDIWDINELYYQRPQWCTGESGGDIFQAGGAWYQFYAHHSLFDHSQTGNKSCFMLQSTGAEKTIIEYNEFRPPTYYDSGIQAINIESSPGTWIIKNNIFNATTADSIATVGIYGTYSGDTISGNVFIGMSRAIVEASGTVVTNNTFYNNATVFSSDGSGFAVGQLYNNIFWLNTTNFGTGITYPTASDNLTTDPTFTDGPAHDFTLQSGSSAIDAGRDLTYRINDIVGTAVPQGSDLDIGAYEYIP